MLLWYYIRKSNIISISMFCIFERFLNFREGEINILNLKIINNILHKFYKKLAFNV